MFRPERRAVVLPGDEGLTVEQVGDGQVGRVAAVAVGDRKGRRRVELDASSSVSTATPCQRMSSWVHLVTHEMSTTKSREGKFVNCCQRPARLALDEAIEGERPLVQRRVRRRPGRQDRKVARDVLTGRDALATAFAGRSRRPTKPRVTNRSVTCPIYRGGRRLRNRMDDRITRRYAAAVFRAIRRRRARTVIAAQADDPGGLEGVGRLVRRWTAIALFHASTAVLSSSLPRASRSSTPSAASPSRPSAVLHAELARRLSARATATVRRPTAADSMTPTAAVTARGYGGGFGGLVHGLFGWLPGDGAASARTPAARNVRRRLRRMRRQRSRAVQTVGRAAGVLQQLFPDQAVAAHLPSTAPITER